eukprot:2491153-Ditylum_brightwellii.AAC.1
MIQLSSSERLQLELHSPHNLQNSNPNNVTQTIILLLDCFSIHTTLDENLDSNGDYDDGASTTTNTVVQYPIYEGYYFSSLADLVKDLSMITNTNS